MNIEYILNITKLRYTTSLKFVNLILSMSKRPNVQNITDVKLYSQELDKLDTITDKKSEHECVDDEKQIYMDMQLIMKDLDTYFGDEMVKLFGKLHKSKYILQVIANYFSMDLKKSTQQKSKALQLEKAYTIYTLKCSILISKDN